MEISIGERIFDFSVAFLLFVGVLYTAYRGKLFIGLGFGPMQDPRTPTQKSNPPAYWALTIFWVLFLVSGMVIIVWFPDWIPRHQ